MIVHRYLFREVLQVFVAVMAVLLLIYVSNRFVRYLAQAASGYISSDLVTQLMLLKLAENLPILLPLALYLAVLLAMGRLYRDSEIIAMTSGGIGVRRLAHALLWFGAGFALFTGALSLYVAPKAAELQRALFDHAKGKAQIAGIQAGRFKEFGDGARVAYVETVSPDGATMSNVFVRVQREGAQDLLVAERAFPLVQGEAADRFMVLENGHRYTGRPGQLDFVITHFERHGVRLEQAGAQRSQRVESVPTLDLLRESDAASAAELQWRIALPLSVLVLVLLAVPMARTSPRQGRYARLLSAFILYFIYNNGIGIARKLVERDEIPVALGVWPVHVVFAAIAIAMIMWQTSPGWRRPRPALAPEGDA